MRRLLVALLVLLLLALDWAALDDITTGNEPDFFLEWAILVASVAVFAILIFSALRNRLRSKSI